jgi:serine/threonine-protein kinase
MTPNERFEFVNRVVDEALDLPSDRSDALIRDALIRERCGSETSLAAEALALLALADSAPQLLDGPAMPVTDVQPGDVLGGRFRLMRRLGSGGAGSVFLADDRYLGEVALKVMHAPMSGHSVEQMAAEVASVRSIRHPNVCPVYDLHTFESERGEPIAAFTMKYFAGETLAQRIARSPLNPEDILRLACGIASGIDALHAAGTLHCDLKPGNIVLAAGDGAPTPVIVDFGLAVSAGAAPAAWVGGSPQYMAPEQFRRQRLSAAADVYAFGLILYEMIAGSRPYPDEDLLAAAIRRNVESASSLASAACWAPHAWDEAIRRALRHDPLERPRSAGKVIEMMAASGPSLDPGQPLRRSRSCRHTIGRVRQSIVRGGRIAVDGRLSGI